MSSVHLNRYKRLLKQLQAARLEAELTQAQVAKALGRPQSFVSKCESGERRVDPSSWSASPHYTESR